MYQCLRVAAGYIICQASWKAKATVHGTPRMHFSWRKSCWQTHECWSVFRTVTGSEHSERAVVPKQTCKWSGDSKTEGTTPGFSLVFGVLLSKSVFLKCLEHSTSPFFGSQMPAAFTSSLFIANTHFRLMFSSVGNLEKIKIKIKYYWYIYIWTETFKKSWFLLM